MDVGFMSILHYVQEGIGQIFLFILTETSFSVHVVFVPGAVVAWVYRVAGKDMAPLEALVFGVGQTTLAILISFSRILATL